MAERPHPSRDGAREERLHLDRSTAPSRTSTGRRTLAGLPTRIVRIGLLTAVCALFNLACPAQRQRPETPELRRRAEETERRLARVEKIREVMERDLTRIRSIASAIRDTPPGMFRRPFPLALFKHVAVQCLNAPASREASEPPTDTEDEPAPRASTVDLGCEPRFADRLVERLDSTNPGDRAEAVALLRDLDRFHTLRVRLRTRLSAIRDIVGDNRRFLASRRAELRNLRKQWRERRAEIGRAAWRDLRHRFERFRKNLQELEKETTALEQEAANWPNDVDEANRQMYFTITSDWKRPPDG